MKALVDTLRRERRLTGEQYLSLLAGYDDALLDYINGQAHEVAREIFGSGIYKRGLLEITNYCRNDCYYCGIRRSNMETERYRLTREEILECCREGDRLGFRTFVLQGGEDTAMSDAFVEGLVRDIRREFPHTAITLSLGERNKEAYSRFFDAGANRYLLRHETACPEHYGMLHPSGMSFENRMECLRTLRDTGYQTGTGMMVGSPGQTLENLVEDILFIERFKPKMIGIGPYIPQHNTPFAGERAGSMEMTLLLISVFRLMFPHALIPSTTALASLAPGGRIRGILAGANVVMPNLTPPPQRSKYSIYDHKAALGAESAQGYAALEEELKSIGCFLSGERGDYAGH